MENYSQQLIHFMLIKKIIKEREKSVSLIQRTFKGKII
jgi:hypothetical protein